ncbi:OsmC family protein [Photobacterium sp. 1_MG-2023]|uniref:OsmC family protein n=1 Tax=Photobacterium sp. 1_MG-2023 TaxID=3062646 RepID=UPI0026E36ED8|nr:OsmC family protein [Photobacterium sp. 1_MG-2023]MDO6707381.1 OsmC family protein [Photobacterium sp. 1_MG-2023]
MSKYYAKVVWTRGSDEQYTDNQYSRGHEWMFDGGVTVPASSSPHVVPLPYSVEANVDPEEAFVASLSSCHMLFFLAIAAKKKFIIDQYTDNAVGLMEKDSNGKIAMTKVILRPEVKFSGEKQPSLEQLEKMHHQSHEQCFIANSVKTEVITEIISSTSMTSDIDAE